MRFHITVALVTLTAVGASAQEAPSAAAGTAASDTPNYEGFIVPSAVQTASQRTQSLIETGPGVTVLDAAEIQRLGVQSVTDILRYAVGAMVTPVNANFSNFGLRGTVDERNNRVLVLLDGRNPVEMSFGFTRFQYLPLHPDDIERIEILRGPSTTRFGANALSGVINIIRKRPVDHAGIEGTVSVITNYTPIDDSNPDDHHPHINSGGTGHIAYAAVNDAGTAGFRLTGGSIRQPEFTLTSPGAARTRNGEFNFFVNGSGQYKPSDELDIFVNISHSQNESIFSTSSLDNGVMVYARESALTSNLKWSPVPDFILNLQVDGQLLEERFPLQSDPSGESSLYIPANSPAQNAIHGKAIIDYTFLENRNTLSLGFEASRYSEYHYYQSNLGANYVSLALEDELRLLADRSLVLSAGARLERAMTNAEYSDGSDYVENKYGNFNPRGSIVYRIDRDNAIRVAAATAYRTPTPYENFATFSDPSSDPAPTPINPVLARQNSLRAEQARSIEAGYRGLLFGKLLIDSTFYLQSLRDIIINGRQQDIPSHFINLGGSVNSFGAELATAYNITRAFKLSGNYTYNYSFGKTDEAGHIYTGQSTFSYTWPIHIYSLIAEWRFAEKWRFNGMYWAALRSTTRLEDLKGGRKNNPDSHWLEAYLGRQIFSGGGETFISVRNALGFARDVSDLRYSWSTTYDPMGAQVIFGLRVSEVGL